MNNYTSNNQRIAKNTLMLYIRMIFLMFVNLYTSRVVLSALGVEDYGVYNAVGGFVAMFGMISTSLSGAISRYITFSLAKDDINRQRDIFSTAIIIQFLLCGILVLLGETFAVWFLNTQMIIPEGRISAANWVLQFSILTFAINLISIPFNALIIAHEKMSAFAYIGIFEGVANLGIAFLISYSPIDSLVYYAILMFLVSVTIRFFYGSYCSRYFPESKFKYTIDKNLIRNMFGFAGWNFIGTTSGVLRSQGINILINIFCGPSVNAARGLAMQANNAINKFSSNFTMAVRPQITKSYAVGDKASYENLVFKSSKFSFIILMFLCVPVIGEADFIMNLWLVQVPQYAVEFVQVILLLTLTESFSHSLVHLLLATGNIKKYQLMVGGLQLLNFPIAYLLLKMGMSPVSTVLSTIFISILCLFLRLYLLHDMMGFPVRKFCLQILGKSVLLLGMALVIPLIVSILFSPGWTKFIVDIILTEISCLSLIVVFALTKSEKNFIFSKILQNK